MWLSFMCVRVCSRFLFYDHSTVNFTVLEWLPKALFLLTLSMPRVTVKFPRGGVVFGFQPQANFLLCLPQGGLLQDWQGWRRNSVDFGCIWFRDGLRYITLADVTHSTLIKLLHSLLCKHFMLIIYLIKWDKSNTSIFQLHLTLVERNFFFDESSFCAPHQMLPFVRELLQLLLRANLMLFYFEGDLLLDSYIVGVRYENTSFLNLGIMSFCRPLLSYIQTCCRHSLCVHWKSIKSKTQVLCFEALKSLNKVRANKLGNFPIHLSRITWLLFS